MYRNSQWPKTACQQFGSPKCTSVLASGTPRLQFHLHTHEDPILNWPAPVSQWRIFKTRVLNFSDGTKGHLRHGHVVGTSIVPFLLFSLFLAVPVANEENNEGIHRQKTNNAQTYANQQWGLPRWRWGFSVDEVDTYCLTLIPLVGCHVRVEGMAISRCKLV